MKTDPKSAQPLSTAAQYILLALAREDLHGYGIIREVEQLSKGRVRLRAGTLYGALERLAGDGWVEVDGVSQDGGPPRTDYRLTAAGRRRLEAELDRLEGNVKMARARLRRKPT